jgi:hypothetical protein
MTEARIADGPLVPATETPAHGISFLLGLIWQVNDKLSFDVGVREARTSGHSVSELRAGLTVGFSPARRLSTPHQ